MLYSMQKNPKKQPVGLSFFLAWPLSFSLSLPLILQPFALLAWPPSLMLAMQPFTLWSGYALSSVDFEFSSLASLPPLADWVDQFAAGLCRLSLLSTLQPFAPLAWLPSLLLARQPFTFWSGYALSSVDFGFSTCHVYVVELSFTQARGTRECKNLSMLPLE